MEYFLDKIFVVIFLLPFLWRNNFDLKPKKHTNEFKISTWHWASLTIWTTTYILALGFGLYNASYGTPGFVAGIGWCVLFAGIIMRRLAYKEIGIYYHPSIGVRDEHQVIDVGVYRYLRHPLHLGLFLEISGWSLMSESWIGLTILLVALVTTVMRNISEEKFLNAEMGEIYTRYCERTWDIVYPFRLAKP